MEMKRETIKVFKFSQRELMPLGTPVADSMEEARGEAGFNIIDRLKENGATAVMIEDTQCLFYDDISWTIRVDYYAY